VYGDDTMLRNWVFEWHRSFKEGKENVENDPRSEIPATSRTGGTLSLSTRRCMEIAA